MKIGLFFGSFNPVHVGHLIIANHVASFTDIDQVWLVISPQNPFKQTSSLLNEYHRLHLAQLAIGENNRVKTSDVEFKLPKPSYTIDTLTYLTEKYPSHTFSVIIGSDSFQNLHKWKNAPVLMKEFSFLVYERPGFEIKTEKPANVTILNAPLLDISATMIRHMIKEKKSIQYLVPDEARLEIELNNYYK